MLEKAPELPAAQWSWSWKPTHVGWTKHMVGWGTGVCWFLLWPTLSRRNAASRKGMVSLRAQAMKDSLDRMLVASIPEYHSHESRERAPEGGLGCGAVR